MCELCPNCKTNFPIFDNISVLIPYLYSIQIFYNCEIILVLDRVSEKESERSVTNYGGENLLILEIFEVVKF